MNDEGKALISKAKESILNRRDKNWEQNVRIAMNEVYRHFKVNVTNFNDNVSDLLKIFALERMMKNIFLPLKSKPDYSIHKRPSFPRKIKTETDCEKAMAHVVYLTRKELSKTCNVRTDPLDKKCVTSSSIVSKICDELGITQRDFSCNCDLSTGLYHCFNIISFELPGGKIKRYLIDCTYRQFFTYADSFLERCGLIGNQGCCIGRYMLMNDSRKSMAEQLLKNGYIEMNQENTKNYFDGFVLQGRNGKYYEKLGKKTIDETDYSTNYTAADYIKAINENGLETEKWCSKGMMEPLKNPTMLFDVGDELNNQIREGREGDSPEKSVEF